MIAISQNCRTDKHGHARILDKPRVSVTLSSNRLPYIAWGNCLWLEGTKLRKDPDNALYFQAQEMLESTNVYKKQVSDICYKTKNGEKSLILLVKDELAGGRRSRDKVNGERINNKKCFLAIQNAMADYVSSYPAPASFKKRVRLRFAKWLQDIARKYGIPDEQVDEALDDAGLRLKPGERDTVIDTVKALHSREGITKEELSAQLGISQRAVLKNLCKLDPGLREKQAGPEPEPFYLGGQSVRVKISPVLLKDEQIKAGQSKKRFITKNTMNPILLQENLMETVTLLQALSDLYDRQESWISSRIATDIWSQLSEYTRTRIIDVFCRNDSSFADFVEMINDEVPDDHMGAFYETERDMAEGKNDISDFEKLVFYAKVGSRRCYLKLQLDDGTRIFESVRIEHISGTGPDESVFIAKTDKGEKIPFQTDQVVVIMRPGDE